MIRSGKGGASTKTGAVWEMKTSLECFFKNLKGYQLKHWKEIHNKAFVIFYNGNEVAYILKQHAIYAYLKKIHSINPNKYVSKLLIPDDTLFVVKDNVFFIIECKHQETAGSVDEKLQTCDFKIKQWRKILCELNLYDLQYIYLLNDWFKDKKYKDVLDYISSINGCSFFFNYIPLKKFNLPIPE